MLEEADRPGPPTSESIELVRCCVMFSVSKVGKCFFVLGFGLCPPTYKKLPALLEAAAE